MMGTKHTSETEPERTYCPNCGTEIEVSGRYCPECGTKIPEHFPSKDGSTPAKSKKKFMIIAVAALTLIILLIAALFHLTQKSSSSEEPTPGISETPEISDTSDTEDTADSEYLFPESDTEYLTDADIADLSADELALARNEIIARHGRIFTDETYKSYFEGKSWYQGTIQPEEFDANYENELNEIEKANITLIQGYEQKKKDAEAFTPYIEILNEYRQGYSEGYRGDYFYVANSFTDETIYQNNPVYYAAYDFCNDGTPELLISCYYENSNTYEIMDIFSSDGTYAERMIPENGIGGPIIYNICENNVLLRHWNTAGVSHGGGIDYYQMEAGKTTLERFDGISHDSLQTCYRTPFAEGVDGDIQTISYDEYMQIQSQYVIRNDIPFNWKPVSDWAADSAQNTQASTTKYHATASTIFGSKYDIIDFDMKASSTLQETGYNYDVNNLKFSAQDDICWSEGVAGNGIGETIYFSSSDPQTVDALYIVPGFTKSREAFYNNGCPTKITISCGTLTMEVDLSDYYYNSNRPFMVIPLGENYTVTECSVTIDAVRPGAKYDDTCITRLYFIDEPYDN